MVLVLVTVLAWRENLSLGFTDVDALADAACASGAWLEQPLNRLTCGWGGSNANFWRPVVMLHYKLLRTLFGMNPVGWQLWDLGLHLVCVGLVGALGRGWRGLAAGAIVALHPLQVEVVPAVARNIDLLLGLFTLVALLFARRGAFIATVLATALALGSKETAVAALPVIVLWWWVHHRKHAVTLGLALAGVLGAYLAVRTQVLAGLGGYGSSLGVEGLFNAFSRAPVASLFPGWSDLLGQPHWGWQLTMGLVVLALVLAPLLKLRRPLDLMGLGLWLLPLVLYGITDTYSRRLMYLPVLGLALWLGGWAVHSHLRWALAAVIGTMLPHVVLIHGHDWAVNDQVTRSLSTDAEGLLREAPEGARVWVMDRCVRFTEDRARVRTWQKSGLNNCVALYSLQSWADDIVGRDQELTLLNLSYPTTALDTPQVKIDGDAVIVDRSIQGRAFYSRVRDDWDIQEDGDVVRLRFTGERQDDHLLIASGGEAVLVRVP